MGMKPTPPMTRRKAPRGRAGGAADQPKRKKGGGSMGLRVGAAIHTAPMVRFVNMRLTRYEERRLVRIMAIADGYVMCRRNGYLPYVAPVKEFEQP